MKFAGVLGSGLVILLTGSARAQFVPTGAEFQVNSYDTYIQRDPAVAMAPDGGFVVVWSSHGQDDGDPSYGGSVQGQRYTSNGAILGGEFQVNSYTTARQSEAAIAFDSQGNFVVVWYSAGQDDGNPPYGGSVQGQRFNSGGMALASEFQVNSFTTGRQSLPAVAMSSGGSFSVVWQSSIQDGSGFGVFGQRYDATGMRLGTEFQINSFTTFSQFAPAVASDSAGNFVVMWESDYQDDSTVFGSAIEGQRYSSAGLALAGEFQVNSYTSGPQLEAAVSQSSDGDHLVAVWRSFGPDGNPGHSIQGQRFSSDGSFLGAEFQVNSYTPGSQLTPSVAVDSVGNFVVVWTTPGTDGSGYAIEGQYFESDGTPVSSEFQVNTYTTGNQSSPAVSASSNCSFVVVWRNVSGSNIRGQRFVGCGIFFDGFESGDTSSWS